METSQEALAFAESSMRFAADMMKDVGELRPMTILLVMRDPKTKQSIEKPMALPICYESNVETHEEEQKGKEMFADFLRKTAAELCAVGAIFMSEVWMVLQPFAETKTIPKDLGKHPERLEAVILTLEHRAFNGEIKTWVGRIKRDDAGACTSVEFVPGPPNGEFVGRFVNILPVVN